MIGRIGKEALGIVALLFLSLIEPGSADVLLVPEDYPSIAEALGAASHGDTVSLATGNYSEHDLVLPPGVSVLGRGSREDVVIDAQGAGRVLWGEDLDENNVLESFTLRGGSVLSGYGGGAYLSGTAVLRNLLVEGNTAIWFGAGIYAHHVTLIEDCVFKNNWASSSGGGLYISTSNALSSTIRRVDFIGNESQNGAALFASLLFPILVEYVGVFENTGESAIELWQEGTGLRFQIENSVLANNESCGIKAWASGTILNCTIVHGQSTGIVSNGIPEHGGVVLIDNSIVAFNVTGILCGEAYAYLSCSDVYGNLPDDFVFMADPTGTDGNISEDPLFCPDSGPREYPLREDSPCAPGNHPDGYDCGLIGAFPIGCGTTATEDTNWSRIKRLY